MNICSPKNNHTFTKPLCLLATLIALLGSTSVLAQGNSPEKVDQFYLQLNLENLQHSKTGTSIIDSVFQVPFVQKQWKAIPPKLEFLKQIELQTLTLSAGSSQLDIAPLFDVRAKFDSEKLVQVLSHAKEYTTVESGGTTIHHWITNFDSLIGGEEGEDPDYIFLANPSDGRLLVSTSLARLVSGLKNDAPTPVPAPISNLEAANTILSLFVGGEENGLPGDLVVVAHESSNGRLNVNAQLKAHDESKVEDLADIAALVANPQVVIDLLSMGMSQKGSSEVKIETSQRSKANEELLKSNDNNQISVSCRLNRGKFDQQDYKAMIECFFKDCVKSKLAGDMLSIDVGVFLGPCEVTHVPGKRGDGDKKSKVMNSMTFVFDAYTNLEEMEVGNRLANANAADSATQSK